MTTNKPDDTTLEEQLKAFKRSNAVLRQTYLHLKQANADLMEIIDKFIERTNPDERQGRMRLSPPTLEKDGSLRYGYADEADARAERVITDTLAMQDQAAEDQGLELRENASDDPVQCGNCGMPVGPGGRLYHTGHPGEVSYCRDCFGV